jgi:integral membrane sensor domain MASE1
MTPQVTAPQIGSGQRNKLAFLSLYSGIASWSFALVGLLLTVTFRVFPDLPTVPAAVAVIGVAIAWMATGVGAIATAHIARRQIRRKQETGSRQATVGLILGYSFLLFFIASAIFLNGVRCPCV